MSNVVQMKFQNKESFILTGKGAYSVKNNGEMKPLFQRVKLDTERKSKIDAWTKLKPVYFQKWVWEEVCRRQPLTYSMDLPVYQGQKVMMT